MENDNYSSHCIISIQNISHSIYLNRSCYRIPLISINFDASTDLTLRRNRSHYYLWKKSLNGQKQRRIKKCRIHIKKFKREKKKMLMCPVCRRFSDFYLLMDRIYSLSHQFLFGIVLNILSVCMCLSTSLSLCLLDQCSVFICLFIEILCVSFFSLLLFYLKRIL